MNDKPASSRCWQQALATSLCILFVLFITGGVSASLGSSQGLPSTIQANPLIEEMIDQVTTETLYQYAGDLTGEWPTTIGGAPYTITNRHTDRGVPIQMATQYVYEHFSSFGLEASYHEWKNSTNPNVIGTIHGLSRPSDIVLLTAHLDNMPNAEIAPGADDNASGTAAVMAAAAILSQYQWDCTLRFVAFTGEEQGLHGSFAYASLSRQMGEQIMGVLNLDMIGYNSQAKPEPVMDLHARSTITESYTIAEIFTQVVVTYGINLTPNIKANDFLGNYSDNKSFWDFDYPAVLAIEDRNDTTSNYHSVNDRLSTLNMEYFADITRAAVGTMAHMGCLRLEAPLYLLYFPYFVKN